MIIKNSSILPEAISVGMAFGIACVFCTQVFGKVEPANLFFLTAAIFILIEYVAFLIRNVKLR